MNAHEADQYAMRLKGLLPKTTQEQMVDWARRFEQFDPVAAGAAISRYVEENDELSTPRLLSLIRAEVKARDEKASASRYTDHNGRVVGESFVEMLRRKPGGAGKSDRELLIEDMADGARALASARMEDPLRARVRSGLYRTNRDRLVEAGVPQAEAEALARSAFGYSGDEVIPEAWAVGEGLLHSVKAEEDQAKLDAAVTRSRQQKQMAVLVTAEVQGGVAKPVREGRRRKSRKGR